MRKLTDKQKDRQRQTLYSTLLAEAAGPKKKKKKTLGDIIILHLYTTNDDHMIYGT